MDKDTVVNTLEEYIKTIFRLTDNNYKNPLVLRDFVFRGQDNKEYDLIPSIGRNRKSDGDISILNQERNMIEMAKNKLPNIFKNDMTPINLLALLQHYGIPTRLLDVTTNPLVALYFATLNSDTDGEVLAIKYKNTNVANYPMINAIADSYRFVHKEQEPINLDDFYHTVLEQSYFDEQRYGYDTINGGDWIKELCKDIIIVNTQEYSERQRTQQGLYILFPNKIKTNHKNKCFVNQIKKIPKDNDDISRLIIPKESKKAMLQKLGLLGISEDTLFRDSIDIVCKNIKESCYAICNKS